MFLIGDVTVMNAQQKEYDGRKYYKMQVMAEDKVAYSVSARFEDNPRVGDKFQLFVEPDSNYKPVVRCQKVK